MPCGSDEGACAAYQEQASSRVGVEGTGDAGARPIAKPYQYIEELAELVPWSVEAIRKKVQRGELKQGVHYFQERARGRLIFKWEAIVALIERVTTDRTHPDAPAAASPVRGRVIDVERATEELRRLLR